MSRVKAVVFDWAGTVIDFGSRAPMGAFVEVFKQFGVDLTVAEARQPMGLPKWDHIRALGSIPRIAEAWEKEHGAPFSDADADRIHAVFEPLNARVVTDYADLVPGTVEVVAELRRRGIKIGSTTGYTRAIMTPLLPLAARQGYSPDNLVCAGDLPTGRPTPAMMLKSFVDLGVGPAAAVIKVDDTAPGIHEGTAAGCWAVGVALSGNAVGLSAEALAATPDHAVARLREAAAALLREAGAHYVIDTVADLLPIVDEIENRLENEEVPPVPA